VGGRDIPVGVGRGLAVGDGPGAPGPVGLADGAGVGTTAVPLAALGVGLAVVTAASCRASAMTRADSGASWSRAVSYTHLTLPTICSV